MGQITRAIGCALLAALVVVATPALGRAQGYAVRAGAHINPDQFSVGGQYEHPISDRYWLQPNVDVGFGNDATLVAGNCDAVYRRSLTRTSVWTGYAGGGPALNWYKLNGYSATEMGVNALGGLMHASGMFLEASVGFLESPRFRFGVGYAFGRSKTTGPQRTPPRRRK